MVTSRPRIPALTRKLLRDVWRLRGQVLSIAAVVACGVMIVVAMNGTLRSVQRAVDAYYARYRFGDVFASATRAPANLAARLRAIPGVALVEPRVALRISVDVPSLSLPVGARLLSLPDAGAPALNGVHVQVGRTPRAYSLDEAVVSSGFAAANRIGVGDSIGAVLEGRWRRLHVVGVAMAPEFIWELSAAGSFTVDDRAFGVLWMSRRTVEGAAGMQGAFNDVVLRLAPGGQRSAVIAAVDSVLARYGGFGAVGRDRHPSHAIVAGELRSLRVFGITIPLIFLAVAGFLVNVVLARLVATQRAEIAALKAFGYTDREVGLHFLGFASAAVVLGTMAGLGLGVWIGTGYTGLYTEVLRLPDLRFAPDAASALASAGASMAAAAIGAFTAVRDAVRLQPADAMRPESPERYRPLLLERLGLSATLRPAVRMVLRHIEHRPARSASTIAGVMLSVALLGGTLSLFEAAFYMVDLQFRRAQREDVSVTFNRARPTAAAYELARMPGVVAVETFRVVPVRVRHRTTVRTTLITGTTADAALHRIVDQHNAVFRVPATGAILTTAFARTLGVGRGDTLQLELLELGGAARRVPVAGVVDELFGSNVYMEQGALARLLGETPRANGAYLRVDPVTQDVLLERLKRVPSVSGASSRQALIAAWDRQMLQSIRVSGSLVVACAVVITLGAVYNGARISLSEQGRELASLRVLGFRRREVAALLFGEQALLTVAALPFGVVLAAGFTMLLARSFISEDQRFPVVFAARTFAGSIAVVLITAVVAALLMLRRLNRMDLVAVLKTRE